QQLLRGWGDAGGSARRNPMFTRLLAVIAAMVRGHMAPVLVDGGGDWRWYGSWLAWAQASGGVEAVRRWLWLPALPCVVVVAGLGAGKKRWRGQPSWAVAGRAAVRAAGGAAAMDVVRPPVRPAGAVFRHRHPGGVLGAAGSGSRRESGDRCR